MYILIHKTVVGKAALFVSVQRYPFLEVYSLGFEALARCGVVVVSLSESRTAPTRDNLAIARIISSIN
jgi:hypothetical protein